MELAWYGLSCFRMRERNLATVVTDPFGPDLGLPALKLRADVVTISHDAPGHSYLKGVKGQRKIIEGPGEYEVGNVFITGIAMAAENENSNGRPNTLYVFDFNGLSVAHLGDLSFVPTQSKIENLGPVHVALVPVGGGKGLSPAQAAEVISLIEPSVVVPMQFKTGKETIRLGQVTRFLSEMGTPKSEPQGKLKVTKGSLPDSTQVVVLEPVG